jgi:hypothetical protein
MAVEKLGEGIRNFNADTRRLEQLIWECRESRTPVAAGAD